MGKNEMCPGSLRDGCKVYEYTQMRLAHTYIISVEVLSLIRGHPYWV